jgi:flagellar biosynthesis chaperone FliJ
MEHLDGRHGPLEDQTPALAGDQQGRHAERAAWGEKLEALVQAVQWLGDRLAGLDQRLAPSQQAQERPDLEPLQPDTGLDALSARVLALESAQPLEGEALRQTLESVRDEFDALQQGLRGLHGEETGIRQGLAEMAAQIKTIQDETSPLIGQVAVMEDLLRRQAELEQNLMGNQGRVEGLAAALEISTAAREQEAKSRAQDIGKVRTGLRLVGWSGVVAILVVIALTVAGYLLSDRKQNAQWQELQVQVRRLDQRITATKGPEPQDMERLQRVLDELRMQLKVLAGRIQEEVPEGKAVQPEGVEAEGLKAQQSNLFQALDDLTRRVAELEDRVGGGGQGGTPRETHARHLVAEPTRPMPPAALPSVPTPEAPPAVAATPVVPALAEVSSDTGGAGESPATSSPPVEESAEPAPTLEQWQEAQKEGYYTLQLMAAHSYSELEDFAHHHGFGGQVAWLAPSRSSSWYSLVRGIYSSRDPAIQGLRGLADQLPGIKPWVRRIPRDGEIQLLP